MLSLHFQTLVSQKPCHPNVRKILLPNEKSLHARFTYQNTCQQRHRFHAFAGIGSVLTLKDDDKEKMEEAVQLPKELSSESMPQHVAVIMDGNKRWAQKRGLPVYSGHQAGARSLRELIKLSCRWGIRVLTVFAFSVDNWARPNLEVDFLISKVIERALKSELDNWVRENIRVSTIGDLSRLPKSLQAVIGNVEETTRANSRLHLIFGINYSGKYDVVQACKSVAQKVKDGLIQVDDITEDALEQELETKCCEFPRPDLLIRTSGELRISNFLLWQSAYSELFFAPALWPDFGKAEFVEALTSYQQRQRRYGGRPS